jgi:hypothetical protein
MKSNPRPFRRGFGPPGSRFAEVHVNGVYGAPDAVERVRQLLDGLGEGSWWVEVRHAGFCPCERVRPAPLEECLCGSVLVIVTRAEGRVEGSSSGRTNGQA